jgi:hypothetical protein
MRMKDGSNLTAAILLTAISAPGVAMATSGTCTITNIASHIAGGGPGVLDLPPVSRAAGIALPVTFDEANGTFSLTRDVWASTFGPTGAEAPTGFGPGSDYFLIMTPGTVTGTIDAGGNITLPGFPFTFSTDVCEPPKNTYGLTTTLETGLQILTLGPTPVEVHGTALDFSTGSVELFGAGVIPAPCLTSPLVSGINLTCTLSPIPDRSKLPAAPKVTKVTGVGKLGKPLPATQPSKPDKGDVLTLNGVLTPGGAKLDFTSTVIIRVTDSAGTDLIFVEVPTGTLARKGKAYVVNDPGGSVLTVLIGQKSNGPVSSTTGGTVRFTQVKKTVKLAAKLQGLDLSGLNKTGQATIAVGPYTLTAPFAAYHSRSSGHKG